MRPALAVLFIALAACGPGAPADTTQGPQDSTGAATSGGPTSGGPGTSGAPTTGAETSTSTSAGSSSSTGAGLDGTSEAVTSGFIGVSDGLVCGASADPNVQFRCSWCDVWGQNDCKPGEKCVPRLDHFGGIFKRATCMEVVEDPAQPGEPCTYENVPFLSPENCDFGAMCWNVDAAGQGTCVPLCTGSPEAPACAEPAASCSIDAEGELILCLPGCDPRVQDCPAGDKCVPNPVESQRWLCAPQQAQEPAAFAPCDALAACEPGLFCGDPLDAVECAPDQPGCCLSVCDLAQPACPGAGQQCVPWYPPGEAPSGLEDLGRCALP